MDNLSNRRLAENEVILRQVNTDVKNFALSGNPDDKYSKLVLDFYCECSNMDCRERISLTPKHYDQLHKDRSHFVLKPQHIIPEIEDVVSETPEYMVVKKKEVPPLPEQIDATRFI